MYRKEATVWDSAMLSPEALVHPGGRAPPSGGGRPQEGVSPREAQRPWCDKSPGGRASQHQGQSHKVLAVGPT